MKKLLFYLLLFFIGCSGSYYLAENKDTSLSVKDYNSLGMPKIINTKDDLSSAVECLKQLAGKSPEKLPRYNSRKSGDLFQQYTSFEMLSSNVEQLKSYQEKHEFLMEYIYGNFNQSKMSFLRLYTFANAKSGIYHNEQTLLLAANIYARILLYEAAEKSGKIDEFSNTLTKTATKYFADDLYYLENYYGNSNYSDVYIKSFCKKQVPELKERILKLTFIDKKLFEKEYHKNK